MIEKIRTCFYTMVFTRDKYFDKYGLITLHNFKGSDVVELVDSSYRGVAFWMQHSIFILFTTILLLYILCSKLCEIK